MKRFTKCLRGMLNYAKRNWAMILIVALSIVSGITISIMTFIFTTSSSPATQIRNVILSIVLGGIGSFISFTIFLRLGVAMGAIWNLMLKWRFHKN